MDHTQIERTMLTGYPTKQHSDYEMANEIDFIEDHPVEDMFGTEIAPGEGYFVDRDGRVVHSLNLDDYMIEVVSAQCFTALK